MFDDTRDRCGLLKNIHKLTHLTDCNLVGSGFTTFCFCEEALRDQGRHLRDHLLLRLRLVHQDKLGAICFFKIERVGFVPPLPHLEKRKKPAAYPTQ